MTAGACPRSSDVFGVDARPDLDSAVDASVANLVDSTGADGNFFQEDVGQGLDGSQGETDQASKLTVSPAAIDLGGELLGVPSSNQTIMVTSRTDVTDLAISVLGDDLTLHSTTCGRQLAAGASCAVLLTFLSTTVGNRSDSLVIVADGRSTVVPVTAKVQAASHLEIYPNIGTFSYSGQPITFYLANAGDTDVGPMTVKVTGANAGDFIATATGCDIIARRQFCTISVVFARTLSCSESASLVVTGPAPEFWTNSVPLISGPLGGPNPLNFTSSRSDFGPVAVDDTGPSIAFTLHNSGTCSGAVATGPLTLALSTTEFVITDDACSRNVLENGEGCTVSIALRPTSAGVKSGYLLATTPSGESAVQTLTGSGVVTLDGGYVDAVDGGQGQREAGGR